MCVWVDKMLMKWGLNGGVSPFFALHVNPASIDLTLGDGIIDLNTHERLIIGKDGLHLYHGKSVLASTLEYIIMPNNASGLVLLKSSMARSGLDHAMAGYIDPGFNGNITLELSAHRDITLHPGQRIVNLILIACEGVPNTTYNGRYQYQIGVTPAKAVLGE